MADAANRLDRGEVPGGKRRANLIEAISHPVRRRILRAMGDAGAPSSPAEMAKQLELPAGTVGYHTQVNARLGAVEPEEERIAGVAAERPYRTTIIGDPPIESLLEETRAYDEQRRQGTLPPR